MSICVAVKVPEGVVLAADSASSIAGAPTLPGGQQGPQGIVKVFYNATKALQIRSLPVGVVCWGAGSFQVRTIASLIEEFGNEQNTKQLEAEKLSMEELAGSLWEFLLGRSDDLFEKVPREARPLTGLLVAGYSGDRFFPELYRMGVPMHSPESVRPDRDGKPWFGAVWYGLTDAIVRFHHGRDDRFFEVIDQALRERSGSADLKIDESLRESVRGQLEYPVLFHAMPLNDAVEYAEFVVDLTIKRCRFVVGAELCGGPIDVATVTKQEGFAWRMRKGTRFRIGEGSHVQL